MTDPDSLQGRAETVKKALDGVNDAVALIDALTARLAQREQEDAHRRALCCDLHLIAHTEDEGCLVCLAQAAGAQTWLTARAEREALTAQVQALTQERDEAHARAIAAEHHKALSLMGRGSYAEVVEDKLRAQLAEEQIAREHAEAEAAALRAALEQLIAISGASR